MALYFQAVREGSQMLEALLEEANERGLWKDIRGEAALTVKMTP